MCGDFFLRTFCFFYLDLISTLGHLCTMYLLEGASQLLVLSKTIERQIGSAMMSCFIDRRSCLHSDPQ
jgi:hypothetical protein